MRVNFWEHQLHSLNYGHNFGLSKHAKTIRKIFTHDYRTNQQEIFMATHLRRHCLRMLFRVNISFSSHDRILSDCCKRCKVTLKKKVCTNVCYYSGGASRARFSHKCELFLHVIAKIVQPQRTSSFIYSDNATIFHGANARNSVNCLLSLIRMQKLL